MSEENKPDIREGDELDITAGRWKGIRGIVQQEPHYNPNTEKWCVVFKAKYVEDGYLYMARVEDVWKLNK